MAFRLWYEIAVGIITVASIIIFGEPGIKAIVLLAFLPIIMRVRKIKADERETFLFYKGTQIIFTALIFLIVTSFIFTDLKIEDILKIKRETWFMILAVFMVLSGIVRLFLHYKN